MTDNSTIQTYINNFRRRLTPQLKPGVGLICLVHPAEAGGAVLEFKMGPQVKNDDVYQPVLPNLGKALSGIPQKAFGGNLEGFRFGGTNVVLEADRIILIKDGEAAEWNEAAAEKDVHRILPDGRRTAR